MFRRISGSSSITNIFFMVPSKNRQPNCNGGALADSALYQHLPVMQVGTPLHEHQTQSGARTRSHVASAMKGFE
jgi:hypothetical protein